MRLRPSDVDLLAGRKLSIPNLSGGTIDLTFPSPIRFIRGGEGYAIFCDASVNGRTLPSVFKAFYVASSVRQQRTDRIVREGFARTDPKWMFQGAPYMVLDEVVSGVTFSGHVAQLAGAPFGRPAATLFDLRDSGAWDAVAPADRAAMAADLARAVCELEARKYVHGDLSLQNVMIGPSDIGRDVACLIDFDGFEHAAAPRLPRAGNIRPLGNSGFVSPEMLAKIAADVNSDDDDVYVSTDRFALAVSCLELMCWSARLYGDITAGPAPRDRLFNDDMIARRDYSSLPGYVVAAFPRGFELFDRTLSASSDAQMPAPAEWVALLDPPREFTGMPLVRVFRGADRTKNGSARLRSPSNSFYRLHKELGGVSYTRLADGSVTMRFPDAVVHSDPRGAGRPVTPQSDFRVLPGDSVRSGAWEFVFENETI
jgi:hypothetical protein